MGMFDRLMVNCPHCGGKVEHQSKAYACDMTSYSLENAPRVVAVDCPKGYSTQHKKLGGKSIKTKNIRSATPRGITRAIFEANSSVASTHTLKE